MSAVLNLSERLSVLLDLLEPCRLLADIGTDHGLIPAHAVLRGKAERALAIDLREEPLRGAAKTMATLRVAERVTLVRGDGLEALRDRNVDAVVLAGLGGKTFLKWCTESHRQLEGVEQLLIQPNRHAGPLRAWAHAAGLHLRDERLVFENGRAFVTCAFRPGVGPDPAYAGLPLSGRPLFELGPHLFSRSEPATRIHYEAQEKRLRSLLGSGTAEVHEAHAAYASALASLSARFVTETS